MDQQAKVGDPLHIVRGELLKRKLTLKDVADGYGCTYIMVNKLLTGYTTSRPLTEYINSILARPPVTN